MIDSTIHFLKKTNSYISGEEISRALNISRAGVWKDIQELKKLGYEVEAVPHLGYRLIHCPDRLYSYEIQSGLKTKTFGKEIHHYQQIDSTMNMAFQLGMQGAAEGTLICAEGQFKGRGRLGRRWSSPEGKGVYLSLILKPQLSPMDVPKLTLLAAVAVAQALRNETELPVQIKWPNDLLINEKKLGGILTELSAEADRVQFVVIGMGLNVNTPLNLLPANGTSLCHESGKAFLRVMLVQRILEEFEQWYRLFQNKGFCEIAKKWKELSATLNRHIRIEHREGHIEGEAIDIDDDGGLLIRKADGQVVKKLTGDVRLQETPT